MLDQGSPVNVFAVMGIILVTIVVVHLVTMFIVLRKCFGGRHEYYSVLYTFVCPPVFVDWEEIYR